MPLIDTITNDLKEAMKAREEGRLRAIKNIRAAFIEALKVDGSATLSDEQALAVLRIQAKRRVESITQYRAAGRDDLAVDEEVELAVINGYLPSLADEATTRAWVAEAIAAVGAAGPRDMGKVMGHLTANHKGEYDSGKASGLVKEALAALGA
jgi:uncharacterized protein YqeY